MGAGVAQMVEHVDWIYKTAQASWSVTKSTRSRIRIPSPATYILIYGLGL
ncbi:hypothetical protein BMS3Abin15_00262 [bacterium BMS3Abin15]|nr:hypothetical protein BMS3Abin15_00262 [bacterium BMS3Abin15]